MPIPYARFRTLAFALALSALLGAAAGRAQLTALGAVVLDECDAPGDCLSGENFGHALAVGDFNGDGFADLAVDVLETVGGDDGAGAIHVLFGSPGGLTHDEEQFFDGDSSGIGGSAEPGDRLGFALASGDFNLDDFDDLAIGIPFEDVGSVVDAGTAVVLFGSANGLTTAGSLSFNQDTLPSGSSESAEENDLFGYSLAVVSGRVLAIGAPGETFIPVFEDSAGRVHVVEGLAPAEPLGVVTDLEQNDYLAACGGSDGNEAADSWGSNLTAVESNSLHGLAIAGEFEDLEGQIFAGRVTVDLGSFIACFDQNTPGVEDEVEALDRFGGALAAGKFDGDSAVDLAIGVPGELNGAGVVQVLFGTSDGLSASGDILFAQDNFPEEDELETGDHFGDTLAVGDFDGDNFDDLAIGVPDEDIGTSNLAGAIHVRYGAPSGFDTVRDQTFHSNFPASMPDSPNDEDHFGRALATGDFDGSGTDDLAIGVPGEDLGSADGAGMVTVLYGLDRSTGAFGKIAFSQASQSVAESASILAVVLVRSGGAVLAASVDHSRTGGTATPGSDFTYSAGSESWAAGDVTTENFALQVEEDTLDEPNETLVISLSNPSTGTALGSPSTFTLTITDNDVAGSLSFAQSSSQFAESAGQIQVPVVRSGGAASAVTVHYATSNASATAGADYVAASGTLTWAAGETTRFVPVTLLDDGLGESTEAFLITLSNPGGGGTLGAITVHAVVILDDDVSTVIFLDGFETGNTSRWSDTVP